MWAAILNTVLGLWLMFTPAVFGIGEPASHLNHIIGPLVITFAVIALWEVNRNAQKANILMGLLLVAGLFVFDFNSTTAIISNIVSAIIIIGCSFVPRKLTGKYGGGWKSLFQKHPPHLEESKN